MKTMSSNSFQGFFLEFGNIYLTLYSKMIITFPSHLYLKYDKKQTLIFFWVWIQKLKASLFLILSFWTISREAPLHYRLSGLTCCPQDYLSLRSSTHSSSKAPFLSKPHKQRRFYIERELITYLSHCTQKISHLKKWSKLLTVS